jgi:hypothetical protein
MAFTFLNPGIEIITDNTGTSFEIWLLIIVMVGSVIFMAKDFKLGVVIQLLLSGGLFMWFYQAGYNWVLPLVLFFINLIILAFTLYAVSKSTEQGTVI